MKHSPVLKRICALTAALLLTAGCTAASFADEFGNNWSGFACKYSSSTDKIIAPKGVIKTTGFTFAQNGERGISVTTPDGVVFPGNFGTSVLMSRYKTTLDGLSVRIMPDDLAAAGMEYLTSSNFALVFTEGRVDTICNPDDHTGLYWGNYVYTNGLRHLLPEGNKGLCVGVSNSYNKETGRRIASSVTITYYDGVTAADVDLRPGFRYSFTARNHPDTPNSDDTGISRGYESIDITDGLTISVRADTTHGYIVSVNGKDFYKGSEVGYFPNATYNATRPDVDLTGLTGCEGYIGVGGVSSADNRDPVHCAYTLEGVSGIPAACWRGDSYPELYGDVAGDEWYALPVLNCYRNKLMVGTGNSLFSPDTVMTRAMLTQACARMARIDLSFADYQTVSFSDVKAGSWYAAAVEWANESGIDRGTGGGIYGCTVPVTRLECAGFLYRLAGYIGLDTAPRADLSAFTDAAELNDAASWCVASGVMEGTAADTFSPEKQMTRGQSAQIIEDFYLLIAAQADN